MPKVAAGFEVYIECGSMCQLFAQSQKCVTLGVILSILLVKSLGYNLSLLDHNATHQRVWPCASQSVGGELQAALHIFLVV